MADSPRQPRIDRAWCRVLVVDHDRWLYGSQLYALRQAEWLERHGVELILAGPAEGKLAQAWRDSGRRHVALEMQRDRALNDATGRPSLRRVSREMFRVLRGAWRTASLARRVDADVLDVNSFGWAFNEVVLAGWLVRRPTLLHLHMRIEQSAVRYARAIAVRTATATLAVSGAVVEAVPSWARKRVEIVRTGIDTDRFFPAPADPALRAALTDDPDAPIVLMVTRVAPGKGIEDAIRAVAALPGLLATTRLIIAGGAFQPGYEQSVHRLGSELLGDRVWFIGPRTDIDQLLRVANVLVLPSESEGAPLCVLEAQASGTPVVTYPAGGACTELIRHNVTGLLAEQGNVEDLSVQLGRVLSDPALAKELAANALETVLAERTVLRQTEAHVAVLRRLMRRARSKPAGQP